MIDHFEASSSLARILYETYESADLRRRTVAIDTDMSFALRFVSSFEQTKELFSRLLLTTAT